MHWRLGSLSLQALHTHTALDLPLTRFAGRCVVLAMREQVTAALSLLELDGVAQRLVLCPQDLPAEALASVARDAGADALLLDVGQRADGQDWARVIGVVDPALKPATRAACPALQSDWVLLTSGTSGSPKLVLHTLHSLAGQLLEQSPPAAGPDWSTFYDIRRYGGLQILLRSLIGGRSITLSDPLEPIREFLARAAAAGVTHISGTPSHWRRALMSGSADLITPSYVRLSGEPSDQGLLDELARHYPRARIVHAFASTEAGLAFEVDDRLAGFPAALLDTAAGSEIGAVELRIEEQSLLIRSPRTASRYLHQGALPLRRDDGFVDTQDLLELRSGRYYFLGRRTGVINVGGRKCHPEEIEAVINSHPRVLMSRVRARRNPVLGNVIVADIVMRASDGTPAPDVQRSGLADDVVALCRRNLPPYKVPATIRVVDSLDVAASGKIQRTHA